LGLVAKVTQHLADDHITRTARLGDAKLPDCFDWQGIERSKIAQHGAVLTGLPLHPLGRAISPRTFTSAWTFLGRSFFRPLEWCPDDLAPVGPERFQFTATV